MKKITLLLFLIPLIWSSCYNDNVEELSIGQAKDTCTVPDSTVSVSFAQEVMPILVARCGSNNGACHDQSNALSNGGSSGSLADYAGVMETINDRGTADFIQRITHDPAMTPSKYMPKGAPKMEDCKIAKLTNWINNGMQNN
jgi:hypothetical protein